MTVVHNTVRKMPRAALLLLQFYLGDGGPVLGVPKKRKRMIHFHGHRCADINVPHQTQGVLGTSQMRPVGEEEGWAKSGDFNFLGG